VIVVDVNVIAYLLIEGEQTASSERVLAGDPEWAAPLLWRSEWRSILGSYLRRRELEPSAALERLEAAEALVQGREYLVDGARVLDLVMGSKCSAYDCEYVALAESLGIPLVTTDRLVLDRFPAVARSPADYLAGHRPR
jgi:predicted nucleic acid-binding protein